MTLKRVFISHTHDDRELAGYVRDMLQAVLALSDEEIVCTGDGQYGLPPGADLKQELTARLQSTRALFLLATPAARGKEWVNFECGVASQLKEEHRLEFITLIPTATDIDAVPAPYRHAVSVVLSEGDQIRSLVDHIRASLGAPVTPNEEYVRPMLKVLRYCKAIEFDRIRAVNADERQRLNAIDQAKTWSRRRALALAFLGGIAIMLPALYWKDQQLTNARLESSARIREAGESSTRALRSMPFAGLVQDAVFRPVNCDEVEAVFVEKADDKQRTVTQPCDSGTGTFTFDGGKLNADPMQLFTLKIKVAGKQYSVPFTRATARVTIPYQAVAGQ